MTLQDKLEEIKRLGNYAITIVYGENIGCDDLDVAPEDRRIKVFSSPVGVLGEAKKAWVFDKVSDFIGADLTLAPTILNNPPGYDNLNSPGIYLWGTELAIKNLTEELF